MVEDGSVCDGFEGVQDAVVRVLRDTASVSVSS